MSTRGSCIIIGGGSGSGSGRGRLIMSFSWGPNLSASSALGSSSSSSGCSTEGLGAGPLTLRRDRLARKLGSHAGGRKQKRTTDATMREIPMIAMAMGSGEHGTAGRNVGVGSRIMAGGRVGG